MRESTLIKKKKKIELINREKRPISLAKEFQTVYVSILWAPHPLHVSCSEWLPFKGTNMEREKVEDFAVRCDK